MAKHTHNYSTQINSGMTTASNGDIITWRIMQCECGDTSRVEQRERML